MPRHASMLEYSLACVEYSLALVWHLVSVFLTKLDERAGLKGFYRPCVAVRLDAAPHAQQMIGSKRTVHLVCAIMHHAADFLPFDVADCLSLGEFM